MSSFSSLHIKYLMPVTLTALLTACGGGAGGTNGSTDSNAGFTTNKPQASSSTTSSSSSSILASASSTSSAAKSSNASTALDTTAPSAPTNLIGTNILYDRAGLKWDQSTDNVGVVFYKIYRDGAQINTNIASDLTYFDFDVAASRTYTYSISAGDEAGNWSPLTTLKVTTPDSPIVTASSSSQRSAAASNSSQASATSSTPSSAAASSSRSSAADTLAPAAPEQLSKISATSNQVDISWSAATDNVGVTAYKIYRNGTFIAQLTQDKLTYSDKTVLPGNSYSFGVSAGDAAGNWSALKQLSIFTPSNTAFSAILSWLPPIQRENNVALALSEINGYEIRYRVASDNTYIHKLVDKNTNQITLTDLVGDYIFEIAVYDTNGLYSDFKGITPR